MPETLLEQAMHLVARAERGQLLPQEAELLRDILKTLAGDACPHCEPRECERAWPW